MRSGRSVLRASSRAAVAAVAVVPWLAIPAVALAHGLVLTPPEPIDFVIGWSFDPFLQVLLLGSAAAYLLAVRSVDRGHPATPVPRIRTACFLAGIATLEIALQGGIERYDTTLFWDHMVQHMLLMLVAAPLIVLGAPITLALRAAPAEVRRRWILPVLHSRVVKVIGHPLVAWIAFTVVMWVTHLSPLFEAALEDDRIHELEHALFLATALLFWWPVIGLDPSPYRLSPPARILYLFLMMPQNTFLALTIYSATAPLYAFYATTVRGWGPDPLTDQQAAGALMWVWGDLTFLVAMLAAVAVWARDDEAAAVRQERAVDAERAAIREREARLAERLAAEQPPGGGGSG